MTVRLKINCLPTTGPSIKRHAAICRAVPGHQLLEAEVTEGWPYCRSLRTVTGHHRAGEAERGQWRGCSAQSKDLEKTLRRPGAGECLRLGYSCLLPREYNRMSGLFFVLCSGEIMSLPLEVLTRGTQMTPVNSILTPTDQQVTYPH